MGPSDKEVTFPGTDPGSKVTRLPEEVTAGGDVPKVEADDDELEVRYEVQRPYSEISEEVPLPDQTEGPGLPGEPQEARETHVIVAETADEWDAAVAEWDQSLNLGESTGSGRPNPLSEPATLRGALESEPPMVLTIEAEEADEAAPLPPLPAPPVPVEVAPMQSAALTPLSPQSPPILTEISLPPLPAALAGFSKLEEEVAEDEVLAYRPLPIDSDGESTMESAPTPLPSSVSSPVSSVDNDFYDDIHIERPHDQEGKTVTAHPSDESAPLVELASELTPVPDLVETSDRARFGRPGSNTGSSYDSFDEDRTPVPGLVADDDEEAEQEAGIHTIELEAELPPSAKHSSAHAVVPSPVPLVVVEPEEAAPIAEVPPDDPLPFVQVPAVPLPSSTGSPPSSSSVPPASVLSQLSRSTLTPAPQGSPGTLTPRRLNLPDVSELPLPPRPHGPAAPLSNEARTDLLSLLDRECALRKSNDRGRVPILAAAGHQAEVLGLYAEAEERYRQALAADPKCLQALRGLRRLLCRPGPAAQPDEAVSLSERELELASEEERKGHLLLHGEICLYAGQLARAREAFQEALGTSANATASAEQPTLAALPLIALSDLAWRQGQGAKPGALSVALADLAASGTYASERQKGFVCALRIELARRAELAGQDQEAADHYQAVLALTPSFAAAVGLLQVATRLPQGKKETLTGIACAALSALLPEGPLKDALVRYGASHSDLDAEGRQKALAGAALDPMALADLAAVRMQSGDALSAARAHLDRAQEGVLQDPRARADALTQAGVCFVRAKALPEAHGALTSALGILAEVGESDASAVRLLEKVQTEAGHTEAILQGLRKDAERAARVSGSANAAAPFHLLASRLCQGEGALPDLRLALSTYPDFEPAVFAASGLLAGSAPEEAAGILLAAASYRARRDDRGLSRADGARRLLWIEEAAALRARLGHSAEAAELLGAELPKQNGFAHKALRYQIIHYLEANGRVELTPETEPLLAEKLAEALQSEAATSTETQRAADLHYRRALLLLSRDPLPTAAGGAVEAALQAALDREPAHGAALLLLAARALGGGAAVATLIGKLRDRLLAATGRPEGVMWLLRLGAALENEGADPRQALATLNLLRSMAPSLAGPLVEDALARLARRAGDAQGDPHVVLEQLEIEYSREEDPELRFALLMMLGEHYESAGQTMMAAARFEQALELRHGHPIALSALRRTLRSAGRFDRLRVLAQAELAEASDFLSRAAAQERLAILATEDEAAGPGGVALAVQEFQDLLMVDANHHVAVRFLERHALSNNDTGELIHLYAQLGLVSTDPGFAVHAHLYRARLRQRLFWKREREGGVDPAAREQQINELENDFRLALYRDRHSRPALRHVLAAALRSQDLAQVADLVTRLAEICDLSGSGRGEAGDGRAAAVFLTRAAECYEALQHDVGTVVLAFRAALERNSLHLPALRGYLRYALTHQLYEDAAHVAELLGVALHNASERFAMFLLAGTLCQENLNDPQRALHCLKEALRADPTKEGAFERMRVILSGHGGAQPDPQGLAELLREQLLIEGDPRRLVSLRLELATLLRDSLGNRQAAKAELRQALLYEGLHPEVLRQLSEMYFEDAEWAHAAELYLRRARVEKNVTDLAEIYVRLGQIYGEHLPDARRAVAAYVRALELAPEHLGALTQIAALYLVNERPELAIPHLEKLAELATDKEQKVSYLHRIGKLHEGLGEIRSARESFLHAVDLDPMYLPAIGALSHFFDRQSDVQSMRVHLDRAAMRFRQVLREQPESLQVYQALFQIAQWRRSVDQATTLAGVMNFMGAPQSAEAAALLSREKEREIYPGAALRDPTVDELLYPPSIPPGFRNLFGLLHEVFGKIHRVDQRRLEAMGITKREKLPRSGHPLRDLANRLATDLGVGEFDLYVTASQDKERGKQVPICALEPTEPVSLILSHSLITGATEGELRFLLARLLKIVAAQMVIPLKISADDLGTLVGGVVRIYVKDYAPIGIPTARIVSESQRLQKLIPRKLESQLLPFALECSSASLELEELPARLLTVANHTGLLCAGGIGPALSALRRLYADSQLHELIQFSLTEDYGELRRLLGTSLS